MRLPAILAIPALIALAVPAFAEAPWFPWWHNDPWHHDEPWHHDNVPEIGADGSLAGIVAVAGLAAMIWQRRRKRS
jgi:hypothetical protein